MFEISERKLWDLGFRAGGPLDVPCGTVDPDSHAELIFGKQGLGIIKLVLGYTG